MAGHGHGHGHQHENISIDWDSIKWDELTPEERFNYEHIKMHQKHAGHAEMHASMILILIVVLIVSQVCLVQWKKWKPYSYHVCTLAGMFTMEYVNQSLMVLLSSNSFPISRSIPSQFS